MSYPGDVHHAPPDPSLATRLDALLPELARRLPGLELVYLFGSHAGGQVHAGSDVDLAVLALTPITPLARYDLAQDLAHALGRDVDLVDLASASTVMKKEVVANGRLLFSRAPSSRAAFEGRVLSEYARLNEERRPVLERIAREHRIHG